MTPGASPWAQTWEEKRSTLLPHHPSGLNPPAGVIGDLENIFHYNNPFPRLFLVPQVIIIGFFGFIGTFPMENEAPGHFSCWCSAQLKGQKVLEPHTASPALPGFGRHFLGTEGPSLLWVWGFGVALSTGKDLTAKLGLTPALGQWPRDVRGKCGTGMRQRMDSPLEREQGHPGARGTAGALGTPSESGPRGGRCGILVLWTLLAPLFSVIPCYSLFSAVIRSFSL